MMKTTRAIMGMAVAVLVLPADVYAEAWVIKPSVAAEAGYDDNVRLSATNEEDVYSTRLSGEARFGRLTPRTEVRALLGIDLIQYYDEETVPDEDNEYGGLTLQHRLSELSTIGVNGSFKRDTILRSVELFDPEIPGAEPGADVDIGLTDVEVRRRRVVINPSWRRSLSELSNLGIAYRLENAAYDEEEGTDLVDYTRHTLSADYGRELSALTRGNVTLRYGIFEPDRGGEVDTYEFFGGVNHKYTEILEAGFDAGAFYWERDNQDDTGFVYAVYAQRKGELTHLYGRLERQLYSTGTGDLVETDQFLVRLQHNFSPRTSLLMIGRVYQTDGLSGVQADRDYITFEPGMTWAISRAWSVGARYRYRWVDRQEDLDEADSSAVFATIRYTRPTELE